jgi:hypothetical protein
LFGQINYLAEETSAVEEAAADAVEAAPEAVEAVEAEEQPARTIIATRTPATTPTSAFFITLTLLVYLFVL